MGLNIPPKIKICSRSPELTLRKPLDHDLLDDRVIKALKGQEERKERRADRKKQVRSCSHGHINKRIKENDSTKLVEQVLGFLLKSSSYVIPWAA